MQNLRIGREYKEEVLEEWRYRESYRKEEWNEMVETNKFNVVKSVKNAYHMIRHYISGEFGEPTLKDKRDFLFSAVEGDFYACRTWLLKYGNCEGAVDCQNELDGKTALCIACESSNIKLVQLLLSREADPEVADRFGCVALHYAAGAGSLECTELVLQTGTEVDMRDRFGITPLMKAAEAGDPDVVDLLLEFAAAPKKRDKIEKWTALHYAAKGGDEDCILALLKVGVPYDTLSTSKQSAQDVALDHGEQDAAILLGKWRKRKLFPTNRFSVDAMDDMFDFDMYDD